jgi:hypothetical protein
MMKDATLRPTAALKTMVNSGSHVWTWGHI